MYLLIFLLFLFPTSSEAYLDGGSANMLLQLIFGGLAGIIAIIKIYWARIKNIFSRKR